MKNSSLVLSNIFRPDHTLFYGTTFLNNISDTATFLKKYEISTLKTKWSRNKSINHLSCLHVACHQKLQIVFLRNEGTLFHLQTFLTTLLDFVREHLILVPDLLDE